MKTKLFLTWAPYRPFNTLMVTAHVPDRAGVYKLSRPDDEGKLIVFYVGQACDLRDRLLGHLLPSEPNKCVRGWVGTGRAQFSFAEIPRQQDRDGAERALFVHYRPTCNDPAGIPRGPDIEINPR